ncbi:hypothetical protein JL720_3865 [Aureococcus anophagefferens]|nr:hypothetical protein JL720_3865 [Aureococcus anophagefferens]
MSILSIDFSSGSQVARYCRFIEVTIGKAAYGSGPGERGCDPCFQWNGLEILDESTPSVPGVSAKLHWGAATLDDGAMSASVWAADAFGGLDDDSDDDLDAGDEPQRGGFTTFGEDDMGRLATLFEEASTGGLLGGRSHALCVEDDADVLRLCGKTLANARVLDPQRSQNLAITIAPLARAYDGSFVALACALARLTAAPPRVSIEQFDTGSHS